MLCRFINVLQGCHVPCRVRSANLIKYMFVSCQFVAHFMCLRSVRVVCAHCSFGSCQFMSQIACFEPVRAQLFFSDIVSCRFVLRHMFKHSARVSLCYCIGVRVSSCRVIMHTPRVVSVRVMFYWFMSCRVEPVFLSFASCRFVLQCTRAVTFRVVLVWCSVVSFHVMP